jgi:hypothetical protein
MVTEYGDGPLKQSPRSRPRDGVFLPGHVRTATVSGNEADSRTDEVRETPGIPRQDVLQFEGWLGGPDYEAVPAGEAAAVVSRYRRRARKWAGYRVVAVVVVCLAGSAVLFRFVDDLVVAGAVGLLAMLLGSVKQLGARDEGVPEVVVEDVDPTVVRREYGVEPATESEDG